MRNPLAAMVGLAVWGLVGIAPSAWAGWPPENQAIQIIVPAPGDAGIGLGIARLLATQLQTRLGGHFSVSTYPANHGPGSAAFLENEPADGTTLLLCNTTLSGSSFAYARILSGAGQRLEAIGLIAELPNILVVNNAFPATSLRQFTTYVSDHPGVVNFGSIGNGSTMHLAGQLYMTETDSNMIHVAYSSSGMATNNLISGQIQSMFHLVPGILPQIRNHQVRPLAVMSNHRLPALPDVPTMAEQGYPTLQFGAWMALMAPPGTPRDLINQANHALNQILNDPATIQQLSDMGAVPVNGSPEAAQARLAAEHERWQAIMSQVVLPVH